MSAKIAIHTEDEARERLCWKKLGHQWTAEPHLLERGLTDRRRCEASACMAWRWYATHVSKPGLRARAVKTGDRDQDGNVLYRHEPAEPDRQELVGDLYGYCGLAGDPIKVWVP